MNVAVEELRKRSEQEEWLRRELQIVIDEAERAEYDDLDFDVIVARGRERWAKKNGTG